MRKISFIITAAILQVQILWLLFPFASSQITTVILSNGTKATSPSPGIALQGINITGAENSSTSSYFSSATPALNNTSPSTEATTTTGASLQNVTSLSQPNISTTVKNGSQDHTGFTLSTIQSNYSIATSTMITTRLTENQTVTSKPFTPQQSMTSLTSHTSVQNTSNINVVGWSGLSHSEMVITACVSVILIVSVLVLLMYSLNKCKKKRTQYSHRPLHNFTDETADRYHAPDDTLVISGGLYDGPRIYNPNMSILEEEDDIHVDNQAFGSKPTQFKLEFLPEEQERPENTGIPAFGTFQSQSVIS
ncbi:sialomucin core protein 24-like [Polypterus senegalus]|uniref:sialomucin core protein 24-like n=1 Tax=Polypterus senegalus TaxID=55291 RepID=UPI001964BD20|nr:sialomucin core protein 24-like [Polypterus senegalus]